MAKKEKYIDRAQKYIQKGYIDRAISEYQKAASLDPNDTAVRLRLGELYIKAGMKEEAIKEYTDAARMNTQKGFYLKAIAIYKQVLKIDNTILDIHYKLADLYTKQRLIADAISEYSFIVGTYEKKGRDEDVLELVKKMAEVAPDNVGVRLKLAELYLKRGFESDAFTEYSWIFNRLLEEGKYERAEKIYLGLHDKYPENITVLEGLVELYRRTEDSDRFLYMAKPLAERYKEEGQEDKAKALYKEILALDPAFAEAAPSVEDVSEEEKEPEPTDEAEAVEDISGDVKEEAEEGAEPGEESLTEEPPSKEKEEIDVSEEEAAEETLEAVSLLEESIEVEGFEEAGPEALEEVEAVEETVVQEGGPPEDAAPKEDEEIPAQEEPAQSVEEQSVEEYYEAPSHEEEVEEEVELTLDGESSAIEELLHGSEEEPAASEDEVSVEHVEEGGEAHIDEEVETVSEAVGSEDTSAAEETESIEAEGPVEISEEAEPPFEAVHEDERAEEAPFEAGVTGVGEAGTDEALEAQKEADEAAEEPEEPAHEAAEEEEEEAVGEEPVPPMEHAFEDEGVEPSLSESELSEAEPTAADEVQEPSVEAPPEAASEGPEEEADYTSQTEPLQSISHDAGEETGSEEVEIPEESGEAHIDREIESVPEAVETEDIPVVEEAGRLEPELEAQPVEEIGPGEEAAAFEEEREEPEGEREEPASVEDELSSRLEEEEEKEKISLDEGAVSAPSDETVEAFEAEESEEEVIAQEAAQEAVQETSDEAFETQEAETSEEAGDVVDIHATDVPEAPVEVAFEEPVSEEVQSTTAEEVHDEPSTEPFTESSIEPSSIEPSIEEEETVEVLDSREEPAVEESVEEVMEPACAPEEAPAEEQLSGPGDSSEEGGPEIDQEFPTVDEALSGLAEEIESELPDEAGAVDEVPVSEESSHEPVEEGDEAVRADAGEDKDVSPSAERTTGRVVEDLPRDHPLPDSVKEFIEELRTEAGLSAESAPLGQVTEAEAQKPSTSAEEEISFSPEEMLEGVGEDIIVDAGAEKAGPEREGAEEYVDLGAELGLEEAVDNMVGPWAEGESKETVEEFKNGMGKQLSKEDSETHYNLGIAYMEMELYKEAEREFKLALKDPRLEFHCYTRLGICAMTEKNYDEAIGYYQKALKVEGHSEQERMGIMYELALAYESAGRFSEAEELFRKIYEMDPDFREVASKVEKAGPGTAGIPGDDGLIEVEIL